MLNSSIKTIDLLYKEKSLYYSQLDEKYDKLFKSRLNKAIILLSSSSFSKLWIFYFIKKLLKKTKYFLNNMNRIPKEDYINIYYEELCKKPDETINYIINFLGMKPFKKVRYSSLIKERNLPLESNIVKMKETIYKKMKKYIDFLEY